MPHFQSSMRRRFLSTRSSSKPINGNVGDAVFFDGTGFLFVPYDDIVFVEGWIPIGVVVIPTSHNVYGDGTCGVVSLAEMNYSTPDTGSTSYQKMSCGGVGTNTSLPDYNVVNYIGSNGNLNNGVVQGATGAAYLPSDQFSTVTGLDGKSGYYFNDDDKYAPSPYNVDGSRNEAYYTTAYSTVNALSDFDGVGNTKVLTDLATAQSKWKTATTITHKYTAGYYPAACCCWRFHTAGTDQGQWHLPACGEFGYVINRISTINETINKVLSVYSSVAAVAVNTGGDYWSSSEVSTYNARYLGTSGGGVGSGYKGNNNYVRAFLRL